MFAFCLILEVFEAEVKVNNKPLMMSAQKQSLSQSLLPRQADEDGSCSYLSKQVDQLVLRTNIVAGVISFNHDSLFGSLSC